MEATDVTRYWVLTILFTGLFCPTASVVACQPPIERQFEEIAPDAKNILVIQVESLELVPGIMPDLGQTVEGRIRVVGQYRDAGDEYQRLRFHNSNCHGIRIDVGGLYLVATNAPAPFIDLMTTEAAILDLYDVSPFDVKRALKASPTLQRLEAALNGNGTFDIDVPENRMRMSRYLPPPRVPPPEDQCWAQCTALKNGVADAL